MQTRSAAFVMALVPVIAAAQQFLPAPAGPPVDPNTRFEVAVIKPVDPSSGQMMIRMMPGRFESTGVPVALILRQALQKPDYQIIGAPGWINTERYSITGKVPEGILPSAVPVMLVNLLKDRFQLSTHVETRELPIFTLVTARADGRLGPNLKPTSSECETTLAARRAAPPGAAPAGPPPVVAFDPNAPLPCGNWRRGLDNVTGVGRAMAEYIPMLSDITGRPVIDKTGLTGLYDFTLKFAPEPRAANPLGLPPPPGAPAPAIDPDAANLFTAVQEQLGLKLESARGPVEVVVIDKFEKPTLD